jgi:acyl-CoA dehydrogenase
MSIDQALVEHHYGKKFIADINFFRSIALVIDQKPSLISQYLNNHSISALAFDRDSSCLDRTRFLEALSYGDSGVVLACPGPSLAGLIMRELGSEEQKNYFFNYVESHKSSTFFAVTEPGSGSDLTKMQTSVLKKDDFNYLLSGKKWLVGHGADANIGVVLARVSSGPLGVIALLLTEDILKNNSPCLVRNELNMIGLRGARLAQLIFKEVKLTSFNFLGQHLRLVNRGMMALIKTFNRMRPAVAAFALGTAQGILDYLLFSQVDFTQAQKNKFNELNLRIKLTRNILHQAAAKIDSNPFEMGYVSLAKIKSSHIAEACCQFATNAIGSNYLIDHPLLMKWQRDVYGYEYMEGTTPIQRKNVSTLCMGMSV